MQFFLNEFSRQSNVKEVLLGRELWGFLPGCFCCCCSGGSASQWALVLWAQRFSALVKLSAFHSPFLTSCRLLCPAFIFAFTPLSYLQCQAVGHHVRINCPSCSRLILCVCVRVPVKKEDLTSHHGNWPCRHGRFISTFGVVFVTRTQLWASAIFCLTFCCTVTFEVLSWTCLRLLETVCHPSGSLLSPERLKVPVVIIFSSLFEM